MARKRPEDPQNLQAEYLVCFALFHLLSSPKFLQLKHLISFVISCMK